MSKVESCAHGSATLRGALCDSLKFPGIAPFIDSKNDNGGKLDALYVPTHRLYSVSLTRLKRLSVRCDNIYVLPSRHAKKVFPSSERINQKCEILDVTADKSFVAMFGSLATTNNPSSSVTRYYDLPLKRNCALRHARRNGHKFIGLIDDDIEIEPLHISIALRCLQGGGAMAGFHVFDFPDVSTIDHIDRMLTGDASSTMVGGNALFLNTQRVSGFFPYSYNEDWMFVFHNLESQVMNSLGAVRQLPGAPWRNTKRIRFEEFGETVIEGFLALKSKSASIYSGTTRFWSDVVTQRRCYLNELKKRCRNPTYSAALKAALQQNSSISEETLVRFVTALNREMEIFLYEDL